MPAPLLPAIADLPLHAQLMLGVVAGSGLACLGLALAGMVIRAWRRPACELDGLPPLPARFPFAGDQILTALFTGFLLYSAASGLLSSSEGGEESLEALSWSVLILGLATHLALYLPMLLRYAWLHPWRRPAHPWWHYVTQPIIYWLAICAAVLLLQLIGFTPWLIRVTQCPEYQDLVLIFSKGDSMQKLYIIASAVLIAPLGEECCFRAFLYTTLRRWGGCVPAACCSALLFGAIHGSLAQLVPLTIFGLAQCVAYEKARSLWLPIAIHMLFNSASLLATALMLP